jgi:hypothetical protein
MQILVVDDFEPYRNLVVSLLDPQWSPENRPCVVTSKPAM